MKHELDISQPFDCELGGSIRNLRIVYHTFGTKADDDSNVVWICHALTANSDPTEWWNGLVGAGKLIDPEDKFIVCVNIIGSPYGTSSPTSHVERGDIDRKEEFPFFTIRDMVNVHEIVRKELQIDRIPLAMAGSMGGYQVLEWLIMNPGLIERSVLLATGAAETPWGKGIHQSQRLAIEADPTWKDNGPNAGRRGLIAARGIGMITYRNYEIFVQAQTDEEPHPTEHRAASYINYQGNKLADRFTAYDYHALTRAMDSHDIGRGRGKREDVLGSIKQPVLVIGISSDILCPPAEQEALANGLANGAYVQIDSKYGHDGFLIESDAITDAIQKWAD